MKLCLVCNFQFGDEQDLCPKDLSRLVPIGKDPLIGMVIQDRYKIESLVAKGSMGVIYKAHQQSIGRDVAIKVMHGYLVSDEESMKRYHKEAKAASRLNHPNITTVYDFGVLASGQPYIVMDLLSGKALSDILSQRGQLTPNQTLMVMNQVCQALSEAHARGVVHRDIKPENIVIDELPDGRNIHVKVVDFGIATFAAEGEDTIGKITKTGTVCGSPFYMSPEQCDGGKVDKRSDLYSLGIVLFECLTGKVPFDSKDIYQVLTMQVKDPPPRLKKVRPDLQFSDEIEIVVNKALAKEPDARYQTAQEFWAELANAGGVKVGRKPEPTSSIMRPNLTAPGAVPGQNSAGKQASGETVLSYAEQIKLQALAASSGSMPAASNPNLQTTPPSAAVPKTTGQTIPPGSMSKPSGSNSNQNQSAVNQTTDKSTGGQANPFAGMALDIPGKQGAGAGSGAPGADNSLPDSDDFGQDNEELRKKIHEASTKFQKTTKPKEENTSLLKLVNVVALPILTGLVTLALFCVMAIEMIKHTRSTEPAGQQQSSTDPAAATPEALMAQEKLDEARTILEDRKNQGKLSDSDQVTLDWTYIKLSRREAKAKHFKQAVSFLEAVSPAMQSDDEVQSSLKKYRKLASQ